MCFFVPFGAEFIRKSSAKNMSRDHTPDGVRSDDSADCIVVSPCPKKVDRKRTPVKSVAAEVSDGPFSLRFCASAVEAAQILYEKSGACSAEKFAEVVPVKLPDGVWECTYLLSLEWAENRSDLTVDGYGKWNHVVSYSELVRVESGHAELATRKMKLKDGFSLADCHYKLQWSSFEHRDLGKDVLQKRIFKFGVKDEGPNIALISYKWFVEPFDFTPSPHGNSKKNQTYIRYVSLLQSLLAARVAAATSAPRNRSCSWRQDSPLVSHRGNFKTEKSHSLLGTSRAVRTNFFFGVRGQRLGTIIIVPQTTILTENSAAGEK